MIVKHEVLHMTVLAAVFIPFVSVYGFHQSGVGNFQTTQV
jgi:hypothetical protein